MKGVATSGERIGQYRLLEVLGEGGMGVVHLAVDPEGRKVAVKVLRPAVAGDATALRRLAREVDTMRLVHSPHVAEIVDADVTAERPYIVTQYVPGYTLEQVVLGGAPLRGWHLQRLAVGLARALTAIHAAGVIHRDLKPSNVMFLGSEPILIDFGIAQVADSTRLTATGMVIGTPGFLAPEIIEGDDAGAPADVHSWAGTLIFAATGRPPFGMGTFESIFYKITQGTPDLGGVPDALLPLIKTAMARRPEDRPTAARLVELASRIDLDPTNADETRVDRPLPAYGPADETVVEAQAMVEARTEMVPPPVHSEPVLAQPKDFKGLLPPVTPPPPPPPPTLPYGPPPPHASHDTARRYQPQRSYDQRGAHDPRQDKVPRRVEPARPADRPKPYGWYRVVSLMLLAVAVGFTLQLPIMTLLVVEAAVFLLRVGDRAGTGLTDKRTRTGPTGGDVISAVLKLPLGVPKALFTTMLITPVRLFAGLVLLAVLAVRRPDMPVAVAVAYSSVAVVLLQCLGPGSRPPRRQLARMWGVFLPRREIAVMAALFLGMLALVVVSVSSGQPPDTRPLSALVGDLADVRAAIRDFFGG